MNPGDCSALHEMAALDGKRLLGTRGSEFGHKTAVTPDGQIDEKPWNVPINGGLMLTERRIASPPNAGPSVVDRCADTAYLPVGRGFS